MIKIAGWYLPDYEEGLKEYLIKYNGKYQKVQRDEILTYVIPRRTAIDIGAHVGLWTRDLCKEFQRVVAIEPLCLHRECWHRNILAKNVGIIPCAVGSVNQNVNMDYDVGYSAQARIGGYGVFPMMTLDSLNITDVSYIKIDVEDYEDKVLEGAINTIMAYRPIISFEIKPRDKAHTFRGIYKDKFLPFFDKIGYSMVGTIGSECICGPGEYDE